MILSNPSYLRGILGLSINICEAFYKSSVIYPFPDIIKFFNIFGISGQR